MDDAVALAKTVWPMKAKTLVTPTDITRNQSRKLYVPVVDEDHPLLAQDPSGCLSKEVDERTCAMFNRRTGISVLAYRFHWITLPDEAAGRAATLRNRPEGAVH
jgi:hypothetical protein